MAAIILGVGVSKAQRLSNWEAKEMTSAQLRYAATDAWVCISIYEKLMATEPLTPLPPLSEKEQPKDKEVDTPNTKEVTEPGAEVKGNDADKKPRSRHKSRSHHRHHRSSKKKSENEKQQ